MVHDRMCFTASLRDGGSRSGKRRFGVISQRQILKPLPVNDSEHGLGMIRSYHH